MKKRYLLLILFLLNLNLIFAQNTVSDIFTKKEIVWYGFDFSNIRMIGSSGFKNPEEIVKSYFSAWNNVVFDEMQKYNIMKLLKMKNVKYSISMVKELNSKVDPAQLVIDNEYALTREQVNDVVSKYNPAEKNGIGLVFILESFNNNMNKGTAWVTFFDISTKNVLLSEQMIGQAGGVNFRNSWIKPLYNILQLINSKQLDQWQSQYAK